ncbi:MAG: DNA-processing protein DprA [Flavobacteriales bacterium]|nr:DNA-processing protein DprA [Flavobacteriales bacterium]
MNLKELFHLLRLYYTPGIGHVTIKRLLNSCGSAENIFKESKNKLLLIPGISPHIVNQIGIPINEKTIEQEINYISKHHIGFCSINDPEYPTALHHCNDAPFLLFYKGKLPSNGKRLISVVGTRSATEYGKDCCVHLIKNFAEYDEIAIVSGFAYGIDIIAHQSAIEYGLETYAVVGHGLRYVYPAMHKKYVSSLVSQGGMLTELVSDAKPDKENFPKRNRIIAGMCEATIVIEASEKGGALITARLANGYHRDVFAFPGRVSDVYSKGCNLLIKNNEAQLVETAEDILVSLGFKKKKKIPAIQSRLFVEMDPDEKLLVDILSNFGEITLDDLSIHAEFPVSKTAALLLTLEMKGVVQNLPGKKFKLTGNIT